MEVVSDSIFLMASAFLSRCICSSAESSGAYNIEFTRFHKTWKPKHYKNMLRRFLVTTWLLSHAQRTRKPFSFRINFSISQKEPYKIFSLQRHKEWAAVAWRHYQSAKMEMTHLFWNVTFRYNNLVGCPQNAVNCVLIVLEVFVAHCGSDNIRGIETRPQCSLHIKIIP